MLSETLNYVRVAVSGLNDPVSMCFDEQTGLLYVADSKYNGSDYVSGVVKVYGVLWLSYVSGVVKVYGVLWLSYVSGVVVMWSEMYIHTVSRCDDDDRSDKITN